MISSAIFSYRLWLFSTMLSKMAKDRCKMETSTVGWLTYPAICRKTRGAATQEQTSPPISTSPPLLADPSQWATPA